MAVGICFFLAQETRRGGQNDPRKDTNLKWFFVHVRVISWIAFLRAEPTAKPYLVRITQEFRSITHIRWSRIKELLGQVTIQSLQDCVFRLRALFILLRNVDQSQVVMGQRVIVLESD